MPPRIRVPTIRVPGHRVDDNTNVARYQPRHGYPELAPERIGQDRRLTVARAAGVALFVAGAAVLAVVVTAGHGAQPSGPSSVASSVRQDLAAASTTKTASPAAPLGGQRGVATRAARSSRSGGVAAGAASSPAKPGASGRSPASPSVNPAAATSPAVNLPVPTGFGPLLRRTWVSADPGGLGIKASDVRSTVVGSVYYAEQAATGTYWAISQFVPSARAQSQDRAPHGKALLAQFDGVAVFEKSPGRAWAYLGAFSGGACSGALPVPVLGAWGICTVGS